MASTDSRTGFRLPWTTDRSASHEASADDTFQTGMTIAVTDQPTDAPVLAALEQGPVEAVATQELDSPTTSVEPGDPSTDREDRGATAWPGTSTPPSGAAPARRPTKFLADLTRAMQVAAEQERAATLEQYRAASAAQMEQVHGRSATGAAELRRHADDDVAAIKEWSKAEIARVRAETEARISTRREQLEGQLDRHAALIEHDIEGVRTRVASFEREMEQFFAELLAEEDPAQFAARAANLPEPPPFDEPDDNALLALLQEPGLGAPSPAYETPAEDQAAPAGADPVQVVDSADAAGVELRPALSTEVSRDDQEAAMAAIQAAFETAASLETAETHAAPDRVEDTAAEIAPNDHAGMVADAATETQGEAEIGVAGDETNEDEAEASSNLGEDVSAVAHPEPDLDPRIAALGLALDLEAAEAEAALGIAEAEAAEAAAAEAAAAEIEEIPEMGDDALAARLLGLVPGDTVAPAGDVPHEATQVVVTGLVSVASIASFKRHLGRLAGVVHVGVSSGPDGEFIFGVEHAHGVAIRDLIPTLPGFGARVVGEAGDTVQVSAQDPQD